VLHGHRLAPDQPIASALGRHVSNGKSCSAAAKSAARGAAQARARHRLEGAGASVRSVSAAQRHGQETACRRGGDRPRDGRLPVGHRTGGRPRKDRIVFSRCAGPGAEHERWGTPVANYVAGLTPDAHPLDRGKPRDEDTQGGTQPADKSLINRRLSLRSQHCAAIPFSPALPPHGRSIAPHLLTANIRASAGRS